MPMLLVVDIIKAVSVSYSNDCNLPDGRIHQEFYPPVPSFHTEFVWGKAFPEERDGSAYLRPCGETPEDLAHGLLDIAWKVVIGFLRFWSQENPERACCSRWRRLFGRPLFADLLLLWGPERIPIQGDTLHLDYSTPKAKMEQCIGLSGPS